MIVSAKPKKTQKSPNLLPQERSFLGIAVLFLFALQSLSLLILFFTSARINSLAANRTTFAQMVDGTTVPITERDQNWRYPQVIQKTVQDYLTLSFNWLQEENDEGVRVGNGRVPTKTWLAARLLEPKLATPMLEEISQLAGIQGVFNGQTKAYITIKHLSPPRTLSTRPGRWAIDVIATRTIMTPEKEFTEPFNRTFKLQAVPPPNSPITEEISATEKAINNLRTAGLMITDIEPYDP